ncbi:hypothetical protein, partial [Pluralibacter gergoviae]|uniref:hypothetical protein n=1 Tax=Pluralibacter gergoviae TaxID=61647 RepID=UPI002FDA0DDB
CPVQSVTHVTGSYSRRSLDNPGSRQQKSPLRGTSDSDVWLSGTARLGIHASFRLSPPPCGLPRPDVRI